MRQKKQCKLNKAFFTPCDTLEKMIQDTRGKGVSYFTLTNIETGKVTRSAANLKSGEFGNRGVLMNFCPFCGKPIFDGSIWKAKGKKIMSEVICPWCGEVNRCFDELFRHDEEQVDAECNFCGKNITIVQNVVVDYEVFRTGHDEQEAESNRVNNLCGNCYQEIEKNKAFYKCAVCGNAVCENCREQIKNRYPECYTNMSLVIPTSTQEE